MTCLLEQMRIGVEGHARPCVAENPADLGDIEANVDDQMAREGMPKVVKAQPPVAVVESGGDRGATQDTLRDVVVLKRRAT